MPKPGDERDVTRAGGRDPHRRDRIVAAALRVVADSGAHATTHRLIAAEADVPLGSLTYYFSSLDEILECAFAELAEQLASVYERSIASAETVEQAADAVADIILGHHQHGTMEMRMLHEMYAFANHNDRTADLVRTWLFRSRDGLAAHFSPSAARAVDALVEGWSIHRVFEGEGPERSVVCEAVLALSARFPA